MPDPQTQEQEIDLTHYLDILLRRRWIVLATLTIVFLSTALFTFTQQPVYQASTLLVIEKERSSGGAVYANGAMIESSNDDYYQTQYKLMKSESLLQKVYDELKLAQTQDFKTLDSLKKAVTIAPVMRSRLVNVKADSHSPSLAAKITNTLAQQFVEDNLANQLFISKEVLQALQVKDSDPASRRMHESLPAVVNNSLIQNLKADYAKLQSQTADMSKRYMDKHPAMTSLRSNMAALQSQIQSETDKIVQSLKTELSGQLKGNNVRIIDLAKSPKEPIRPKKLKYLLLGAMVGSALGFLLALLVEMLDQSIRTQEDVESKINQPYLGTVPLYPLKQDQRVYHTLLAKETSLTSESVRNMRTMIDFAGVSEGAKQFLVTSSVQEEGKTYVGSNLATAFAQLGEKVLYIDGDLRRPKIHKNFHISAKHGLSDFLVSGKDVEELDGLIQTTNVPGLHVLVCGTRPPNPSELLNTPRLAAVVAWAKKHFARVVVDCTPMFPIHDTLLWGRHIPNAIFVVRYGKTRINLVRNAVERMQTGGIKPLGVAINAARPGSLAYASYGYYYKQYYHDYRAEPTDTPVA